MVAHPWGAGVQGDSVRGPDFVLTTLCLLLALQKWQLGFVFGFL